MICTKGEQYDTETLRFVSWTAGDGSSTEGYSAWAYFDGNGAYLGADESGIEPTFEVIETAIAVKYADPTEGARLVFDESDLADIQSEDPTLVLCVGDRVEAGKGEDHDTGRVERIDSIDAAVVARDSGVKTPADIRALRIVSRVYDEQ